MDKEKPVKLGLFAKRRFKFLQDGCCPFCGEEMSFSKKGSHNQDYYNCHKYHVEYYVRRNGYYTLETDKDGNRKLVAHDRYYGIRLSEKHWDKECQTWLGYINQSTAETIRKVFEYAETVPKAEYLEDSPEFKQAEEFAAVYDGGKCPICRTFISKRQEFIKGSPGSYVKEYAPGWIPSMGGGVWIERDVYKGGTQDRYIDVIKCSNSCHKNEVNGEKIARAIPFCKNMSDEIKKILQDNNYKIKECDK